MYTTGIITSGIYRLATVKGVVRKIYDITATNSAEHDIIIPNGIPSVFCPVNGLIPPLYLPSVYICMARAVT